MTHRPAVVAFDVIETLISLEPLRERLTEIGQSPHMLEAWYTRTLRDGMALSATGDFAPFTEVAESALRGLTGYTVSDEQVAQVMAGFSELPALIVGRDILLICGSAWLVCILGGVIPAWRAWRLMPVEALRYE